MRQFLVLPVMGFAFMSAVHADPLPEFVGETIVVTPSRVEQADTDATFASEVHTRRMIEASGATTLYDYLAQHTSVQVLPSYGNRHAPRFDMRGYGIGDGHQNIVVSLDGRRLNNIDSAPSLLGAIPLTGVERIEITKGSGSVVFGDGATAGVIQIVTRKHAGVTAGVTAGNDGQREAILAAGLARELFSLSARTTYGSTDGTSEPDIDGWRDASLNRTTEGHLELHPVAGMTVSFDAGRSRIDTRYIGPMSLEEYETNPAQNSGNAYTHQRFESDTWSVGARYALSPHWKVALRHHQEDKVSDYVSYAFKADYDYRSTDLALEYRGDALSITAGVQRFDGTRLGSTEHISKNNTGWFAQAQYRVGATTVSAGARVEEVDYSYRPLVGATSNQSDALSAWDIGVNHRLDRQFSLFANVNRAFQAPDIDRFFDWGGAFNAFIQPAVSHTATLGLTHVTGANRMKLAAFRANLQDEIYYYSIGPFTGYNTNLDKTHKYGLELQDNWRVTPAFTATLNYTYTRARIDREDSGVGAYDGKELPGVPRHGVVMGLDWRITPASSLGLAHVWRSGAWAVEDFDNNNLQKQAAYQSTNLAYRYRYRHWELLAAVDNLFGQSNGIWIRDDAIYPVNFTRNWRLGVKANF